jgi:hypothetical protein
MTNIQNFSKYNSIPTNDGLIDSLTIYLPLEKIIVLDTRLIDEFACYYPETGLLLDDLNPPKPIIINDNGINFRFNKVVFPPHGNKPPQTVIRLTLTCKMLLWRYFEGINCENISLIVDYINTREIIKIDVDTVLDSVCNDIDICINYNLLFEPYKQSLFFLKKMTKLSKQHLVDVFPRRPTEKIDYNYGIQFGDRDNGSIGSPFCKFYNKTNELKTHSTEFYERFLLPQKEFGLSIENLIRKEVTIKNSAFKANLKKKKMVDSNNDLRTLRDILNITKPQLTLICNSQLKYYFEKKQFHVSSDLSPNEKLFSAYMFRLVELGEPKIALLHPLQLLECKTQRSRSKKMIMKIIDVTFNTTYLTDRLEMNSITNTFIKMQNLW